MVINKTSLELVTDRELTATDWRAIRTLEAISDSDGHIYITASDLAEYLTVSRNMMSISLKRLDRKGIVIKVENGHYRIPDRLVRSVASAKEARRLIREAARKKRDAQRDTNVYRLLRSV